jgi:hypothetical protein
MYRELKFILNFNILLTKIWVRAISSVEGYNILYWYSYDVQQHYRLGKKFTRLY